MADVRSLYVRLEASVGTFRGQMVAAGASVRTFGQEVNAQALANERYGKSLANIGMIAGGTMVAGLAAGLYLQTQLQQKMLMVATISDEVANNLDHYTQAVVDMSTTLPQTAGELADGLYDIVSSGYDGAKAMNILEVSSKAAAAGMTDTATASRVIVAALNAYGMSAAQAGDVADILFQTVNKGVISFEELAGSLGRVMPTAAAAGVSLDEVGSAMAALTLSGLGAHEAATSLNQTMNKILNPSSALTVALHSIGYESGYAALSTLGLKGTIDKLSKSQGTAADTALKLFPEIRAARGYLALTAAEGKNYAKSFDAISNAVNRAGAAQKAYTTQAEANAASIKRIWSTIEGIGIQAGTMLAPAFEVVLHVLETFSNMLYALPGPVQTILFALVALAGTGMLVGGAFLRIQKELTAFRAGLAATREAATMTEVVISGLKLALGAVGVVLVAATAIYGAYTAHKRAAKQATDDFVEALKQEANGAQGASLDLVVKRLQDAGALDEMKKFGLDYGVIIKGLIGTDEDWLAAQKEMRKGMRLASRDFVTGDHDKYTVDEMTKLSGKMRDLRGNYADAKDAVKDYTKAQQKAKDATAAAAPPLQRLDLIFGQVDDSGKYADETLQAFSDTVSKMQDPMTALRASMENGKSSLSGFTDELQKQVRDMRNYMTNLAKLATRPGRGALVDDLMKLGPQAAGVVADAVDASGSELDRLAKLMGTKATLSTTAFKKGMEALPRIAKSKGHETLQALADQFTRGDAGMMRAALEQVRNSIRDIPTQHKIDMVLQGSGQVLKQAQAVADAFNRLPKDVRTEVATNGIPRSMAGIKALQRRYHLTPKQVLTLLNARDNASVKIDKVHHKADALPPHKNITITAKDNASGVIDGIRYGVSRLTGKTIGIGVIYHHSKVPGWLHNENGGLYNGRVRAFADGGYGENGRYYSRTPQIVPGGANILWGEQSTGWEAYISGKPGMRDRNVKVLQEAASRFGFDLQRRGTERVSKHQGQVVVVQQGAPLSLTVPVSNQDSAKQVVRDVMYEVRRMRRKGRWT